MKQITITPNKTYATAANALKAVEKLLGSPDEPNNKGLRYFVMQNDDGRFFPVFIGEIALQRGIHFIGFNIVG